MFYILLKYINKVSNSWIFFTIKLIRTDKKMDDIQKNKDKNKKFYVMKEEDKFLPDFVNKLVVCETLSGKTITGVLTGYDRYTMLLIEAKDIKSIKPMKTIIFKHSLMSIREVE